MESLAHRVFSFGSVLRASGPDARSFLQGQFTQDLSRLRSGESVYGLWLDRKGKIVADSFVLCAEDDAFWVVSYHCPEETLFERLDAYLIMEEVEIERFASDASATCLIGAATLEKGCDAIGIPLPEKRAFAQEGELLVFWGRRGLEDCLEILGTGNAGVEQLELVRQSLSESGSQELTDSEIDSLAIEGMVPQIGRGFGDTDLPQDLGLEKEFVAFNKGCYLGQEVMARLHAMGRTRKRLAKVSIGKVTTERSLELPCELLDESGKKQGELRSFLYSTSGGTGLAVVSRRFEAGPLFAGDVELKLEET